MPIPIYYINLDNRPDRRDFMEGQLSALGLSAERLPAVTIETVRATERHSNVAWAGQVGPPLRQLACSYSHVEAWKKLLASGHRHAIILEDDVILSPKFKLLADRDDILGADVLRFESWPQPALLGRRVTDRAAGIETRQLLSWTIGCGGYVMSAQAAARLIDHPRLFDMPIDNFLFHRGGPCLWQMDMRTTVPGLCIQLQHVPDTPEADAARSDLLDERTETEERARRLLVPSRWARLRYKLYTGLYDIANTVRRGALFRSTRRLIEFEGDGVA